ncbi:unnamed protein product [Knipowitschia caucasica]|uniref:Uncharacterized protein n=1 Tax=Knipowitschia caucasica TaxID=637954 RepID=A0AAV2M0Z0_KNICA
MFKYRIRMFFNELKVLVFMRSDTGQTDEERRTSGANSSAMRDFGLGMADCGCMAPFIDCHARDDEEEYYGRDPRPRSLAFEEKEPGKLQSVHGLDTVSLSSTASSLRTPQCRICFQGLEQVRNVLLFWL